MNFGDANVISLDLVDAKIPAGTNAILTVTSCKLKKSQAGNWMYNLVVKSEPLFGEDGDQAVTFFDRIMLTGGSKFRTRLAFEAILGYIPDKEQTLEALQVLAGEIVGRSFGAEIGVDDDGENRVAKYLADNTGAGDEPVF